MKAAAVGLALAALAVAGAAGGARADRFSVRPLISDRADHQLVNAWSLAAAPGGVWWVTNESTTRARCTTPTGRKQLLTVTVDGGPTGIVYSGGDGFLVHGGGRTAPARFIFACEDGMIRAWAPTVPRGWSTRAQVTVDSGASGALFRGLALAHGTPVRDRLPQRPRADVRFARGGRYGARAPFATPAFPPGTPRSASPPSATASSSPTPTRAPVNGNDAPSGGYVDEFDLDGRLVAHVGHTSELDQPWGLALAPEGFGRLGGDLLVANFGSERINVYATQGHGWAFRGRLAGQGPRRLGDRLRAGGAGGKPTTLFYAAGPHRWHGATEVDVGGVFGSIGAR